MKTEKRTHRQVRQSVFIFGLAMAIFNFISNLFCQRRTIMYSENTTRNRQGRQSVVIFGLALAMILVMGSMTVSYGENFKIIYESPTEAEAAYDIGYGPNYGADKIIIYFDDIILSERKRNPNESGRFSGRFENKFARGSHAYKIEYYSLNSNCDDCYKFEGKEEYPLSGYTIGTVTKNRTLTGNHDLGKSAFTNLKLCKGVQLTITDATIFRTVTHSYYNDIIDTVDFGDGVYEPCGIRPTTDAAKVVIDNSTLKEISFRSHRGVEDNDADNTPMEVSVTNSKFDYKLISTSSERVIFSDITLSKFHGNTCVDGNCYGALGVNIPGTITIENNQLPNIKLDFSSKNESFVLIRKNAFNRIGTYSWEAWFSIIDPMGGNITITDNSLSKIVFKNVAMGTPFTAGSITIRNNAVKERIEVSHITAPAALNIDGNTAYSILVANPEDVQTDCSQKPLINKFIRNNTVNDTSEQVLYDDGISLEVSGIRVEKNTISSNNRMYKSGIKISSNCYNEIIGNKISEFHFGIILESHAIPKNHLIRDNTVHANYEPMLESYSGTQQEGQENRIFNNIFTSIFARIGCGLCSNRDIWNTDKTSGPNIIGGPFIGGNYYSNWGGTDANNDGFTDAPYVISDDPVLIQDNLPLYAPLVVNTATDEDDANLSDGKCDTNTGTAGDQCSLRAAIQTANARTGDDVIIFNIPGTPLIQVKKPLPAITGKVTINGNTQPGVEVNGAAAGTGVNGLQVMATGSIIKGLTVRQFSESGIRVSGTDVILEDLTCSDNVNGSGIQTDKALNVSGIKASGNGAYGIYLTNNDLTVTDSSANPNIIKDNKFGGIRVEQGIADIRKKIEVSGNGASKGTEGHGIFAKELYGTDESAAVIFTDGGVVRQNAGHGISAQGAVKLDGSAVTVSENGYSGIYAKRTITIGGNSPSGASVELSDNKAGWGAYSQEGDIYIGNFIQAVVSSSVKNNAYGGIWAEGGRVRAKRIQVIGNGSAKGSSGHGIFARVGDAVEGIAVDISDGDIKISQNAGHGIYTTSGVNIGDSPTVTDSITVSDNGYCGVKADGTTGVSVQAKVADILNNKQWGIHARGQISLGFENKNAIYVKNNAYGGVWSEQSVTANNIEVVGNGSAQGSNGHGIYVGTSSSGGVLGIYISWGDLNISQNAGRGIYSSLGEVIIEDVGTASVSDNGGQGIFALLGVGIKAGSVNISDNKGGWGIISEKNNIVMNASSSAVLKNNSGGIRAVNGAISANKLEVVSNKGIGIRTPSNLTISESGKICDNTGGDMVVGGTKTLNNVIFCDSDNDGASDSVEDLAPNIGDINRNNIPDKFEKHVAVVEEDYRLDTQTRLIGIEADGTSAVLSQAHAETREEGRLIYGFDVEPKTSGSRSNAKRDFTPGSTTLVTIWLPEGVKATGYSAYGPTADNATPHWYEFLYDGTTGAEIQDGKIILHLKDGARGDNDLTANGKIVHEGHHVAAGGLDTVIAILRVLTGIEVSIVNADVTGDGKTGLEDAVMILQKVAGLR